MIDGLHLTHADKRTTNPKEMRHLGRWKRHRVSFEWQGGMTSLPRAV